MRLEQIMNETIIKEIKSIYSGRTKVKNPITTLPEVNLKKNTVVSSNKTFFNGVIEKLDIPINK